MISRKQALSVIERLKFFREVCGAVSYAHRHLVIHRDINARTSWLRPKVFRNCSTLGLQNLSRRRWGGAAGHNDWYAADDTGIPSRSRYAADRLLRRAMSIPWVWFFTSSLAVALSVCEPHPARRCARDYGAGTHAAQHRSPLRQSRIRYCDSKVPQRRSRQHRAPGLSKEPERRYQSVEQFSEDIRRHLEGRPVLARKDTIGYRAAKFIRRNKAVVAAASLLFVSLLGGILTTTWEAHRARVQEAAARTQEAVANAEKAPAERRFADVRQLAHSLLFDYHDAIKNLPGATQVHEHLIKNALANLDKLAAEAQGDSVLQRELAAAYEQTRRCSWSGLWRQPGRPRWSY